uniref:Uncharacterized protein n=1 Tax=Strigops habroptila TaxID=2489341 RepID=A0A672UAS1_STRHB
MGYGGVHLHRVQPDLRQTGSRRPFCLGNPGGWSSSSPVHGHRGLSGCLSERDGQTPVAKAAAVCGASAVQRHADPALPVSPSLGCKTGESRLQGRRGGAWCRGPQLPAPQALLARLVVVAAAPHASSDRAVAALQLLQALQGRIHRALRAVWVTEIPLLLQYLAGRKESSLGSAEWEHRVLKFLRVSLEPIEDKAWTVGLSQELSQQLGSSAPGSWEKLFLYKVLGTVLAACQNLWHVQGQVLSFLQATDPVAEPQAMISVVSHAAESHFHLVLDTLTMYSDNFVRLYFGQTCTGSKAQQQQRMEIAQPFCAALMRTYSAVALCAPKEQLLSRVDKEILGDILRLSRAKQRGMQLKLAVVQSITEVCCAIQAVGNCGSFKLSLKQEAMRTLLDWMKREPWDSVLYGVFQALEKLSKLRPRLSREENRNLLAVCCHAVVSYPSEEQMKKGNRIARAALNTQLLHRRGMQDLGRLIETLLETQGSSACFDDMVHVLKGQLTSAMEWKRERALRVCTHLLDVCKDRHEFRRGRPCQQIGSLVGLLGCLTIDCLVTSRQRAGLCLSYLLEMQDNTVPVVLEAHEIRCLCEELDSPDPNTLVKTSIKIAKAVCKCIPPAQAVGFLRAIVDTLLHVTTTAQEASIVWKWVFVFLKECGKDILAEVPEFLTTLYTYMQRGTNRFFVPSAVSLLAICHREAVVSCLLQAGHLMDSNMIELWRSLGRSTFGIQILRCLAEKLNRAGNNCPGTGSSASEQHSRETALETLAITRAISEVVFVMSSTEQLRQLLPHILPSLLRWASETVGEERLPSAMSSWRQLFLEGRVLEQKPCRTFLLALKSVLEKCMEQKWMQLLMHRAVWARLEDPLAHPEGVSLLTSVLLQAGLISPSLVQNLLPWLDSSSVKLRVAAAAFFDEIPESYRTRRPSERGRN